MGLFIEVEITAQEPLAPETVRKLIEACPVDIFGHAPAGGIEIIEDNVDECTLCELCLAAAPPGAVRVLKLYEEGEARELRA